MNYLLTQIFLCILAAFILGAIIGWLWRHITCKKCRDELLKLQKELADLRNKPAAPKAKVAPAAVVEKVEVAKVVDTVVEEVEKPVFLTAPRNDKGDDLKLIKGVGKVLEAKLNDKGIYHFDQIAVWTQENIDWMDKSLSFPGRIKREDWIAQAKILAKGLETEFSKKVDNENLYD